MAVNLPEEYYQAHGLTKVRSGSGPHLGATSNMSFDIVEKTEFIPGKPKVTNGQLKCYQQSKTIRYSFTWELNPKTHKFSLKSKKMIEVVYGPLVEVACSKALIKYYNQAPPMIDESRYDQCPEDDPYGTDGKQPDEFYNEFFEGDTVKIIQRTGTTKGNVDLLEIDGFVYSRMKMESGIHCFEQARHKKARCYWTFCPETGWHLQVMDYYVNLWGPWQEIPCGRIPKGVITLSISDD